MTFSDLELDEQIINAISELNFIEPMPIQEKVIPYILDESNPDLIALAQTGTGKTAAFGLPLLQKTNAKKTKIQHIILAPTRELCLQIADDLTLYAKYKQKVKIAAVFGGASILHQIRQLKEGAQILSATPGRLLDLIIRGEIDLKNVETVVLDEADEMLNMGFRDELEGILKVLPENRKTYLFSATMPNEVRAIASNYMKNPEEITVGVKNSGAENVVHESYLVHAKDRYLALKRIVDYYPDIYGIVFCRTRKETQDIAESLMRDGYNVDSLHGDLAQQVRTSVMNKFRIKNIRLLVATDVAARGLDVDDLTHIINYNLPDEAEIYIHRSGRTGRAGKSGTSIVIANLKEKGKLKEIEKLMKKEFNFKNIPSGNDICEKQLYHLVDRMEKVEVDTVQIEPYLPQIMKKLEWLDKEEIIKKFISVEFNRFLEYYKNSAELDSPSEKSKKDGLKENSKKRTKVQVEFAQEMTRFFINVGKMDNIKVVNLIGMILDYTGIKNMEIGRIELLDTFSFFEADSRYVDEILKAFTNQKMKGRKINVEIAENKEGSPRERHGRSGREKREKRSFGDKRESRGGSRDKKFGSRDSRSSRDSRDERSGDRRERFGRSDSGEKRRSRSKSSFGSSKRSDFGSRKKENSTRERKRKK